jgi:hypothetical protein
MTDTRLPDRRVIVVAPTRYGTSKVPSIGVTCERCGQPCWLSQRARLELTDVIVCVVCAMAVIKPDDVVERAPWVSRDLARDA